MAWGFEGQKKQRSGVWKAVFLLWDNSLEMFTTNNGIG